MKHFVVMETSFIGGALLAPGSRVTSDDLGTYIDPADNTEKAVKPGSTLVEVDENGRPMSELAARQLRDLAIPAAAPEIAAVAPFSPNPTRAQAAPQQLPGGVQFAENDLPSAPAAGVESDAAAKARAEQADANAKTTELIAKGAGGAPAPERPQRRSGTAPRRASPKPEGDAPRRAAPRRAAPSAAGIAKEAAPAAAGEEGKPAGD